MMSDINIKKRSRATNFTPEEVRLLLKIALKEKHVLENKQTDSEAWKVKTQTWEKITELFNSSSGRTFRSLETLRQKYDGMKKDLRKKVNKNKAETTKTGGGKPEYIIIDGPEKELLEVLSLSVGGNPPLGDSDIVLPQTTITGEVQTDDPFLVDFEFISTPSTSGKFMTPITSEEVHMYDLPMNQKTDHEEANQILEGKDYVPIPNIQKNALVQEKTTENIEEKTKQISSSWKSWSPANLKTKKHPCLTPKSSIRESHQKKMDNILNLRAELLRSQFDHIKEEERRAQEKHELLRSQSQQKHDLEIKLLEMEVLLKSRELNRL